MARLKCKCGSEKMVIDIVYTCDDCIHNGYRLYDEVLEDLDIKDQTVFYDEDLRKKASEILGMEILRDEVEDNGQCNIGPSWGAGCSLYACAECGELVDHVAFMDGC